MRTLSAQSQAAFDSGSYRVKGRASVKDSGGTFRDLSTYGGVDWLNSASWSDDVDSGCVQATFHFKREVENLSIAPLMTASAMNLGFNPAGSYAPLIDLTREIKLELAICPLNIEPASGDWLLVFHGRVDDLDPGSGDELVVTARDLGGKVIDAFIEKERVYAFESAASAVSGFRIWQPNQTWALNEMLIPSNARLTGYYYKCTTAGAGGATEPTTWPTTIGGTVTDGAAVWTCQAVTSTAGKAVEYVMQAILDDNLGAGVVTLYTPTSPSWNIRQYLQQREPVMQAIRNLAQQIGWDVKYLWRSATSQFELTFFQPQRSKVTPDRTVTKQQYLEVSRARVALGDIRNVVRVVYSDATALDANGEPQRKYVEVTDSTSVSKYGRRFMEIAEDATFAIDSSVEATTLANSVLSDLALPGLEFEVADMLVPHQEVGDLNRYSANGRHFSSQQDLAVLSVRHDISRERGRTTIGARGKPSGGYQKWKLKAGGTTAPNHKLGLFDAAAVPTFTAVSTLEGGKVSFLPGSHGKLSEFDGVDYHVSTSSGFTPNSATLVASGKQKQIEVHKLKPGTPHYVKAVPRGRNSGRVIRAEPTAEISFTPSYLAEQHFDPSLGTKPGVPNGGFESWWDGISGMPDQWSVVTGAYGSSADVYRSSTSHGGLYSLELRQTATAAKVRCASFPVEGGLLHELAAWIQRTADSALTFTIGVEWYTSAGTLITSQAVITRSTTSLAATGWVRVTGQVTAPTNAAYARITVAKDSASNTYGFLIDDVSIRADAVTPLHAQDIGTSRTIATNVFASVVSGSVVLTKPAQKILVFASYSAHSTVAGDTAGWRANLNAGGVLSSEYPQRLTTVSAKEYSSFTCLLTGPANPGTYTLALEWRRNAGTGTVTMDAADYATIVAIPL